ncbi:MAG: hypothetical protein KAW88_07305 [Candidatus Cloacimonetes bacterium]|nr:hypothetical protein [Candidatus Cloacimonadota bacterium]
MIKIIKSPWIETFVELLKNSKRIVYLACPYIKEKTAQLIIQNINNKVDCKYINSFKLSNFFRGASDLNALRILNENHIQQKNVHNLHAKFFIFDDNAIITSGNLTTGGLRNNLEYGVLIENEIVKYIIKDYIEIFSNIEFPLITNDIIQKAEDIISSVPKEKQQRFITKDKELFEEIINDEIFDEKYDGGIESVLMNLTSWKKDVFKCLLEIEDDLFSLEQIYRFSRKLQELHPQNLNVEPKIRQQLQYLRDLGLIEFVKPGVYKKLWKQN